MNKKLALTLFYTSCATFFVFGIYNGGLGAVLTELSTKTQTSLADLGIIFTFIYTGSLLIQFTCGFLTAKFGRLVVMAASIFLMAVGLVGIVFSNTLITLVVSCFVLGMGQGGIDIVANLLVVEAQPKNPVAALNILHFAFGFGAAAGPALVGLSFASLNTGLPVHLGTATLFFIFGFVFLVSQKSYSTRDSSEPVETDILETPQSTSWFRNPMIWILGGHLLLIVGTQFSIGNWTSVFMTKTTMASPERAAMVASLFWLFLSVGRVLAVLLFRRIEQRLMVLIHIGGAILGALGLLFSIGNNTATVAFLLVISTFFGGMYPLGLAIIPNSIRHDIDKASSIIIALGTVGSLIMPNLFGKILNNVSPSIFVQSIIGLMLIIFAINLVWRTKLFPNKSPQR